MAVRNKSGPISSNLDHPWSFILIITAFGFFILNQRLFLRFLPLEDNYQFSTLR